MKSYLFFCITIFVLALTSTFAEAGSNPKSPELLPKTETQATLTLDGFEKGLGADRAKVIENKFPGFFEKYSNFRSKRIAENNIPDQYEDYTMPEVVTVYRGLVLKSASAFDPDYGMFTHLDDAPLGGVTYCSPNYKMVIDNYTNGSGSYVVTMKVPRFLLNHGRSEDYYSVDLQDLKQLRVTTLAPFVVELKAVDK